MVERAVTMDEVRAALDERRLLEIFGSGTACVISPVDRILYEDGWLQVPTLQSKLGLHEKLLHKLNGIYYGKEPHPWSQAI